jgi:hypothetical protein
MRGDSMGLLFILIAALVMVFAAEAQTLQCLQTDFPGEAKQAKPFSQNLGGGVTFSVNPMQSREDPKQTWFVIGAIGDGGGGYVFSPSDTNWFLAASFGPAFIGGIHSDLRAALGYRSRQLLLPLSIEDKQKAREAVDLVVEAKTPEQERRAIAALKAAHLAQADFEITDYALGAGEPPLGVDWVRFNVIMTLPRDFPVSGGLPVSVVDCPAIPAEAIADMKDPHRHDYTLPREEESRQQR